MACQPARPASECSRERLAARAVLPCVLECAGNRPPDDPPNDKR